MNMTEPSFLKKSQCYRNERTKRNVETKPDPLKDKTVSRFTFSNKKLIVHRNEPYSINFQHKCPWPDLIIETLPFLDTKHTLFSLFSKVNSVNYVLSKFLNNDTHEVFSFADSGFIRVSSLLYVNLIQY